MDAYLLECSSRTTLPSASTPSPIALVEVVVQKLTVMVMMRDRLRGTRSACLILLVTNAVGCSERMTISKSKEVDRSYVSAEAVRRGFAAESLPPDCRAFASMKERDFD